MSTCCSVKGYIDGLALQLKDCVREVNGVRKHVRWTEEHLLWIICIAARQVRQHRGDLFIEDKKLKLAPGCYTTVCSQGCEGIRKPVYLEGHECDDIEFTNSEAAWADSYFPSAICQESNSDEEYRIERIEIDPEDPCKIKITPEVPDDGVVRTIIARCKGEVGELDLDGTFPKGICDNLNAFTQLVLFYVYDMDGMVNGDGTNPQKYMQNYIDLMGLTWLQDLSYQDRRVIFGQLLKNIDD